MHVRSALPTARDHAGREARTVCDHSTEACAVFLLARSTQPTGKSSRVVPAASHPAIRNREHVPLLKVAHADVHFGPAAHGACGQ